MQIKHFLTLVAACACVAHAGLALARAPSMQFGADWRPLDIKTCKGEAVESMRKLGFIRGTSQQAESSGFDPQTFVLVHCIPQKQGVYIEVLAASHSSAEAERRRNQVRTMVFGAKRAPAAMIYPDKFVPFDDAGARSPNYPIMHWGYDTRQKSQQACVAAARNAILDHSLKSSIIGLSVVWGTSPTATVLVSCVPITQGVSILVAATSDDSATAERLRNEIRIATFR